MLHALKIPDPKTEEIAEILFAPGSPMEAVMRMAALAACRESTVLILGESGTGKEVMARHVHRNSRRSHKPFVAVNCAAIAPGLVESELFGHRRGAFTGAFSDRPGRIQKANGGTLFLDEIGDMPLELQARLLRVIQEKRVCPVGGDEEIPVDFRLVCATHRDLMREVSEGRFREDLHYRLSVLELRIPSLRERPKDIPLLLRSLLGGFLDEEAAEEAMACLPEEVCRHDFPGNVRELANLAERYAAFHGELGWELAYPGKPGFKTLTSKAASALRSSHIQESEILLALEASGHHRGKTADKLGVTRRALQYRLARMRVVMGE